MEPSDEKRTDKLWFSGIYIKMEKTRIKITFSVEVTAWSQIKVMFVFSLPMKYKYDSLSWFRALTSCRLIGRFSSQSFRGLSEDFCTPTHLQKTRCCTDRWSWNHCCKKTKSSLCCCGCRQQLSFNRQEEGKHQGETIPGRKTKRLNMKMHYFFLSRHISVQSMKKM